MIHRINIVRTLEGRFEEAVIAYLFIVNISPIIIIPMMWYETRKVVVILNNWTDFEIMYRKTAGRELGLMMKTKTLLITIFLPLLSCASVVITHITMADFELTQVIPYCILDTIIYMMGGYWYTACETLSTTANILAVDFQRVSTVFRALVMHLTDFFSGIETRWSCCDGIRVSRFVASSQQIVAWHRFCHMLHFHLHLPLSILHYHPLDLWTDVPDLQWVRDQGYRTGGNRFL